MIAMTPPGKDRLPWDDRQQVLRPYAKAWNRSCPRRWKKLHGAASARVRRATGSFSLAVRTYEFQKRGVLHIHVILPAVTAHQRHQAHLYVKALDELRHRHDFGYVDRGSWNGNSRKLVPVSAARAGNYLAGYLAPMKGGKITLTETARRDDAPVNLIHVSTKLTTRSGITMRSLRWRRAAWCELRNRDLGPEDLEAPWTPNTWRILASVRQPHGP